MRLSLYGCFYFTFSFVWVWFEEAGDYRFLSAVLKIVSFSADFRHFFLLAWGISIGMGHRVC